MHAYDRYTQGRVQEPGSIASTATRFLARLVGLMTYLVLKL